MRELASSYTVDEQIIRDFVSIAEQASTLKAMKSSFGEFFTPYPVAEHMASHFLKQDLVDDKIKYVDPAVGIGSLLSAIITIFFEKCACEDRKQLLCLLNAGLYGFDIQPSAVIFTRLRLILEVMSLLSNFSEIQQPLFPNISLLDPLLMLDRYSDIENQFWGVIANPPFARLNRRKISFLDQYEDVLYGHVNYYHLFVRWAVQVTRPGGRLVFLLPQSFRSGLYGHRLRIYLSQHCSLNNVTMFTSRTNVFDNVDSPLMVVDLIKKRDDEQNIAGQIVKVRLADGRDCIDESQTLEVSDDKVLRLYGDGPIWFISDSSVDYELLDKVYSNSIQIPDIDDVFSVANGGFVWNQNKEMLRSEESLFTFPLVSAYNISPFGFMFASPIMVEKGRQYVLPKEGLTEPLHQGYMLFVKRTTPKKRGRRIVSAMNNESFVQRYEHYYVENHLNIIYSSVRNNADLLLGLSGWLNSKLLNFIFQMMNGTSHISVSELQLLPIPSIDSLQYVYQEIKPLLNTEGDNRSLVYKKLERTVSDLYRLDKWEQQRVDEWIS